MIKSIDKSNVNEKIAALVTGVGGGGYGHEIVKALRLSDYWILGVDKSSASLGLFDVDEAYVIPPATDPDYLKILLDICHRKEIKVLFPGSEPELKVISRERQQFLAAGIFLPINLSHVIEMCLDKWATMKFLAGRGFLTPRTQLVQSEEEIPVDFPLPAVVKPVIGGGGSNNTFLLQENDEMIFACHFLLRQGKGALLQEYVGTPTDEYTVGVLTNLDGELMGSIALRRHILGGLSNRVQVANRTSRKELSPVLAISSGLSQGTIADFPEVRRACESMAEALQSQGPLNIQCRYVNGKVYPFEINPRFSGTTYIRALMGFNEPDLLTRHHLLGAPISKPLAYRFGQVVRGLKEQVVGGKVFKDWNPQ